VPAVNFIIQQFTKPGDKIIIQPPVYYPFKESIEKNGRRVLNNELKLNNSKYTMNFDELEELASQKRVKMLILCSPHNPVGRVWIKDELIKLGNICLVHNILVIADEIHGDLIFPDHTQIPFASISEEFAQNSITCTAPTKTFNLAGLHVSNVIIPNKKILDEFKSKMDSLDIQVPTIFGAEAMIAAYNHGEPWLDAVLGYIRKNYHYFTQAIKQIIPKVNIFPLEGTYLVWIDFRPLGLSADKIDEIIQQGAKLALDRGKKFGKGGEGFQRFNIACPRSILRDVINKLETAFQPYL
jgi:cystathionine beta-lyase